MGTWSTQRSIQLDAPAERVWTCVVETHEWRRPLVRSMTRQPAGDVRVGSTYETRVAGRSEPVVVEITCCEPPYRLSWQPVDADGSTATRQGSYTLEDLPGGRTRFTFRHTTHTDSSAVVDRISQWVDQHIIGPRLLRQLARAVE